MLAKLVALLALVLMLGFAAVVVAAVPPTSRVRALGAVAPVLVAAGAVVAVLAQ